MVGCARRRVELRLSSRRVLQPVAVGTKSLSDYAHICGRELIAEIRELAEPLQGRRVLHVSATAFGGGVSEILYTLVPLMRDVGPGLRMARDLRPRRVLQRHQADAQRPPGRGPRARPTSEWATWLRYDEDQRRGAVRRLGRLRRSTIRSRPRSARSRRRRRRAGSGAATSTSRRRTRRRSTGCCPTSRTTPQSLFHMAQYVPQGMGGRVNVVPPAIDPLAPKNMALSPEDSAYVLRPVRHRHRPTADVPGLAL